MKNKTAFLVGKEKFELRDSPMPVTGDDDVLVQVSHVGVCGSDMPLFIDPLDPHIPFSAPMVLGHEASGIVVDCGKDVTGFAPGDKVVFEPTVPCGDCAYCKAGHYNLCDKLNFMGPPANDGALSHYVAHAAKMTYKLPEGVSLEAGALVEPMAVGMHAAKRAGVTIGDTVTIVGCGCIGLCTLLACKALGVEKIYVADLFDSHLEKALELGATCAINSGRDNLVFKMMELTDGKGTSVVFETAGSAKTAAMTPDLVAKGGRIMLVGNIHGTTPMEFFKLNFKEANVLLTFRYCNDFPAVISGIASGLLPVEKIVTDRFPFEETEKAFWTTLHCKETAIKVVIEV